MATALRPPPSSSCPEVPLWSVPKSASAPTSGDAKADGVILLDTDGEAVALEEADAVAVALEVGVGAMEGFCAGSLTAPPGGPAPMDGLDVADARTGSAVDVAETVTEGLDAATADGVAEADTYTGSLLGVPDGLAPVDGVAEADTCTGSLLGVPDGLDPVDGVADAGARVGEKVGVLNGLASGDGLPSALGDGTLDGVALVPTLGLALGDAPGPANATNDSPACSSFSSETSTVA